MNTLSNSSTSEPIAQRDDVVRELLGYINFSNGKPDAGFHRNLNRIHVETTVAGRRETLQRLLHEQLAHLQQTSSTFTDSEQASAVIRLVFDDVVPAYRRHHADLLFHLCDDDLQQPFFLARIFEAVLAMGGPWEETDRIVCGSLDQLNDFLGYRPVAILENEQEMQPYDHERFRPIPLYIEGTGVAEGPYRDLIQRTIDFFDETPQAIVRSAHFDLEHMEELALDVRAYDHDHPVYKRTNYMFGEWDPHRINSKGFYYRFIIRKNIVDALLDWIQSQTHVAYDEVLYDASAVLCGTILMASAISGSGPDTHDSTVTLTSLLPQVARQRDSFYARLLDEATGKRAQRLEQATQLTQQPFGHVRQALNLRLARYGARQIQHRSLAMLYARMGFVDASREQSMAIPSASVRIECEIHWRLTAIQRHLDRSALPEATKLIRESIDFFYRGIHCGALLDPWNILGFQGHFPVSAAREDSIPDQRVEVILEIMERLFGVYSRMLGEAAALGDQALEQRISDEFLELAEYWDQFATIVIEELPQVKGRETWESATQVSKALRDWRAAGGAAGDISFWREHISQFQSAKSYAVVVTALLEKHDLVAAMGLLMQWLNHGDLVGLESGGYSINALLLEWLHRVVELARGKSDAEEVWPMVRKLFDYLEANAGEYWSVPTLANAIGAPTTDDEDLNGLAPTENGHDELLDDTNGKSDENQLYDAAYDDVTFQDSADDGFEHDTMDRGFGPDTTEFELINRALEPRLKFLMTLAQLWQIATIGFGPRILSQNKKNTKQSELEVISNWCWRVQQLQTGLIRLMNSIWDREIPTPAGDQDSNVEFDLNLQTKFHLVHTIIATISNCRLAERGMRGFLPGKIDETKLSASQRRQKRINGVYRAIIQNDVPTIRRILPSLLQSLAKQPLLYASIEADGDPEEMLRVKTVQADIRFLVNHLPRLGLLRETWHLVRTAHRMERTKRPPGLAVTEFDRIFKTALRASLESIVRSGRCWNLRSVFFGQPSSRRWRPAISPSKSFGAKRTPQPRRSIRARINGQGRRGRWAKSRTSALHRSHSSRRSRRHRDLPRSKRLFARMRDIATIEFVSEVVELYMTDWVRHSKTMRLSNVEGFTHDVIWDDIKEFIEKYGEDLFHANQLTLGNLRSILHNGVEWYLKYLAETEDPLHRIRLLEDMDTGVIDKKDVVEIMGMILGAVVDKYDRFIEYNTTTTQSDYGEKFYCLLDFMRLEADYDRDAWTYIPLAIAHEALSRCGNAESVKRWEEVFKSRTAKASDKHFDALTELEKNTGMQLPSVSDRLSERFVKPMAINRMLALIPAAMQDAVRNKTSSAAFEELREEIAHYLETSPGAGFDVAPWLQRLEKEVSNQDMSAHALRFEVSLTAPFLPVSVRQMWRQLNDWEKPIARKRSKKKKNNN